MPPSAARLAGLTTAQRKRLRTPHQPVGCWIRPVTRVAIYMRDRWTCVLCERYLGDASPRERTLDHHVRVADGGGNGAANIYTACRSCNSSHGAQKRKRTRTAAQEARIKVQLRLQVWRYVQAAHMLVYLRDALTRRLA